MGRVYYHGWPLGEHIDSAVIRVDHSIHVTLGYESGSPCSRYCQASPGRERGHARRHSSADAHQEEGEELTDQTATLTLTSATARARAQSDSQHDRRSRDGLYPIIVVSHIFRL